jgi:hypothetical protein
MLPKRYLRHVVMDNGFMPALMSDGHETRNIEMNENRCSLISLHT